MMKRRMKCNEMAGLHFLIDLISKILPLILLMFFILNIKKKLNNIKKKKKKSKLNEQKNLNLNLYGLGLIN